MPIVGWLPRYDRADLRFDAIAAIVSWGVMVPVAMAYAGLAGMPPETGLVTAFAALAAYAVFGTSRHLKVTASSSVAILSASVVGAILSSRDPASYVALSAGLALVVGIILVVAGAARLGFLSQFLAISVVTGFVIGLAITITIGQLPGLLGIPAVAGTTLERLVGMGQEVLQLTDPITAVLGVGSLVGILLLKRIAPRIPGPLIALIVGIALSTALDLSARGVEVVGEIQTGVPLPSIPRLPIGDLVFLITGAFGIVFLALAESIGAARSFGARHGYDIDPDQELVALGASNVASGLFGGFAVDASFSNSATAESAGNRTQLASLITAGLILATAIVLAPLFQNLPTTVLAAIVISSVLGLIDIGELRRYYRWKRTDFLLAMTALIGVVSTTALTGMAIAVALSLLAILYQASRPYIAVLGRIPGSPPVFADADRHPTAEPVEGFLLLRPNVPLTFVNADVAKDHVDRPCPGASGRDPCGRPRHRGDRGPRRGHDRHADGPRLRARGRRRRAPARPGARDRPRSDAQDGAGRHDRRGALVPVGRGGGRGALRGGGGTDRGTGAARGRARDRLAESRVRPEGEPGHDHDRDHRQGEEEDVAGRLCDPRGGGTRTRTARASGLGIAGPLPQGGHRRDPGRWHERPDPEPGRQPAEVRRVVDGTVGCETEDDVDHDQQHQLAHDPAALPIDRVVDARGRQQDAEQPEDRPGRPDRRDVATESEAGHRARGGTGQVEQQEPDRPVPALDDRAREVERVHVEAEVEQVAVEQGHAPEAPVLPRRHGRLVELEKVVDRLAVLRRAARSAR